MRTFSSWMSRHNTVLTIAAASVTPILYLVFIDLYSTNVFYGDDWSVAPVVHAALRGNLSLSQLWGQYNESRLFMGNIVDVVFGLIDHLDLRAVILFSAAILIASYAILLALFRQYLGRRLTPIPILVIGVVWFSLADVQNALWAFQVSWYLTLFFLLAMLFALLVPDRRRTLWFALAAIAAIAGSLSTVQGFLLWPLGAICILWSQPRARRHLAETAVWLGVMIVTLVLYFPGYDSSENGCNPFPACSPIVGLHHPLDALRYFFVLLGNVIPGGYRNIARDPVGNLARFEVVGVVLFAAAVFILVQSCRQQTSRERLSLPALLIGYSLVLDTTIALTRSGLGLASAVYDNRYVMANLVLLTGIVIYASAHMPQRHLFMADGPRRVYVSWLALMALTIFLVIQVTVATGFGLVNGRATSKTLNDIARILLNTDRIPKRDAVCEVYTALYTEPGVPEHSSFQTWAIDATKGQLGEFQPNSQRYFRQLGPPAAPFPVCLKTLATAGPRRKVTQSWRGSSIPLVTASSASRRVP